jgi:hypothetical protein
VACDPWLGRAFLGLALLGLHESCAVGPFSLVLIVRATSKSQVGHRGFASLANRVDVIEFQKPPLWASVAVRAHERAPVSVSSPDGSAHSRRDVPWVPALPLAVTGPIGGSELTLVELLDESVQCAIQDFHDVTGRDPMAK